MCSGRQCNADDVVLTLMHGVQARRSLWSARSARRYVGFRWQTHSVGRTPCDGEGGTLGGMTFAADRLRSSLDMKSPTVDISGPFLHVCRVGISGCMHAKVHKASYGTSLFGVLKSSATELAFTPAFDVVHGALLLFGIGSRPSHYGVSRKKWNNLSRVLVG
jgi:hypothetical protein